ncbi:MAG: Activator of Hsp90 ATPase 1 family protein [Flaviaesturariibacter sp.]|nr:Activator of Hsp90 ATPase 1 family protein [Flaviaesturariibacter sp.]
MQTNHQSTYQTVIKAPVEKVWEALTRPELVKQYFFGSNQETDWKVGSPLLWRGEYEGTAYVDKGVVLAFLPNEKLSFSYLSNWSGLEDKPENYLVVSYRVQPAETGTQLTIRCQLAGLQVVDLHVLAIGLQESLQVVRIIGRQLRIGKRLRCPAHHGVGVPGVAIANNSGG